MEYTQSAAIPIRTLDRKFAEGEEERTRKEEEELPAASPPAVAFMRTASSPSHVLELLAHVTLDQLAIHFNSATASAVMYDDGNRLLLVATQNNLYSWPVDALMSQQEEREGSAGLQPDVSFLHDGPVLAARFSLGGGLLAIQRTLTDIEFINRSEGSEFWQRCRKADRLLGFFWVSVPNVDCVLVTTSGLEMFQLLPGNNGLKMVEFKKHPCTWYNYTHETRLVLLASGSSSVRLSGYQFASSGIIRLPRFDLPSEPADRNKRTPAMESKDMHLLTMYGRMYCAHINHSAKQLVLYRFYRDALIRQHTYALYSHKVALSVVDHALVIHNLDSAVVLVLDVLSSSPHPLASPLPPGIPPVVVPSPAHGSGSSAAGAPGDAAGSLDDDQPVFALPEDAAGGEAGARGTATAPEAYSPSWELFGSDMVVDKTLGVVWRQRLDLLALVASCSDRCALIGFLQRRRQDAWYPNPRSRPKQLTLSVVQTMIQEREPLGVIAKSFELLCAAYQEAAAQAVQAAGPPAPPPSAPPAHPPPPTPLLPRSPAVSPEDMQNSVFAPLEEEMHGAGGAFLCACVAEYLRSTEAVNLAIPPSIAAFLMQLLQRNERVYQIPAWVPVLARPGGTSIGLEVAETARQMHVPGAAHAVQDLLQKPHAHDTYVRLLLKEGCLLEALRYVRRHRVETVPPTTFLEAAKKERDCQIYTSVYRFCSEFVPAFSSMTEYPTYTRLLHTFPADTDAKRWI